MVYFLISEYSVYIQTKDEADFSDVLSSNNNCITFLKPEFAVTEEHFKHLPMHSVVILDDYSFNKSASKAQTKGDFLHVINYYLRHNKITLFLIIHNLYSSGLLNEILLAPHLFLAYSNLGYYIMKKLQHRIGGQNVMNFWQEPPRFNYFFCYINCNKNYVINFVNNLFLGNKATMFANSEKFVIHGENELCNSNINNNDIEYENNIEKDVQEYISNAYPKNKNLFLVAKILIKHSLINSTLFFQGFPQIHLADFFAFINNRFDKIDKPNVQMTKFCKYLQRNNIKFPRIVIKNPKAQKLLS